MVMTLQVWVLMYVHMCTYKSGFLLTISLHKIKISDKKSLSTGKELTDSFTELTVKFFR